MKRVAIGLALALATTPAMANEIAGTRVSGQDAVCSEGQSKGIEVNASTGAVSSYCFERIIFVQPIPEPTPTPTPMPEPTQSAQPSPQPTSEPTSEPTAPSNEPTSAPSAEPTTPITDTSTVTIEPPGEWKVPEKSNVLVVNAMTNESVVREETIDEYMMRVLWSWEFWWEALMKWFESLNEK